MPLSLSLSSLYLLHLKFPWSKSGDTTGFVWTP
jgi:hypothetical protein